MSITAEALAPCSKCGEKTRIKIYRSINTSEDPGLKEKIRNGSLFVWECPHCHQANLARYECLYHDPVSRIMVWLVPSGDFPESQMEAISNHTRAMGGYRLRLVSDVGALMEKILIFDAGLDDMAVEMCKYVTIMEMLSKGNHASDSISGTSFHFHRIEEKDGMKYMVFIYPSSGRMMSLDVGFNVYEDSLGIIGRNPDIIPDGPFMKIDQEWISSVIR